MFIMRLHCKQTKPSEEQSEWAIVAATILAAVIVCTLCSAFSFRNVAFVGSLQRPAVAAATYDTNLIYTNLVAWWKMDEASGVRSNYANVGTYDLTEVGTVTTTNGAIYTTSCYMERTDNVYLTTNLSETNTVWSYAVWFVKGPDEADWEIFAKNRTGWYCGIFPADKIYFRTEAVTAAEVTDLIIPSPGTTNLAVFGYDGTNIFLSMNGAIPSEAANNDFTPAASFLIGSEGGLFSGHNIGPVGFWERRLNTNDINFLWNGGAGVKILP